MIEKVYCREKKEMYVNKHYHSKQQRLCTCEQTLNQNLDKMSY